MNELGTGFLFAVEAECAPLRFRVFPEADRQDGVDGAGLQVFDERRGALHVDLDIGRA